MQFIYISHDIEMIGYWMKRDFAENKHRLKRCLSPPIHTTCIYNTSPGMKRLLLITIGQAKPFAVSFSSPIQFSISSAS